MGWLGWNDTEALAADIGAAQMAIDARVDLIGMIFGGKKEQPKGTFGDRWKDRVKTHNAAMKAKQKRRESNG